MATFWQFFENNYGVLGFIFAALFGTANLVYKLAEAKPEQHAKVRGWLFQAADGFFTYVLPVALFFVAVLTIWQFVTHEGPMTRQTIFSVAVMVSVLMQLLMSSPSALTQRRREKYEVARRAQQDRQIKDMGDTIRLLSDRIDRLTDTKRTRI